MAESLQQLLVTNFGSSPSGYTGSQGTVGYVGSSGINGYTGSAGAGGSGILISNIQVTDSSYTVLDDTAVDTAGGYIKITGSGFAAGCSVLINQTAATSVTFVSSTEVRAQVPATTAGTYIVYLVNTSGDVAIRVNGITFSATPTWVTGSSLAGVVNTAISIQLAASLATTYALQSGSTLPSGVTLSNVGLISGTVSGLSSNTTYNFTVVATDAELQDSPRAFALTITIGDEYFKNTTLLLSGNGSMVGNTAVKPFTADVSTNNFAVTANGDARSDDFEPYSLGYYSNYFDGTGDYLSTPAGACSPGANNFTFELWFYPNADTARQYFISSASDYWFALSCNLSGAYGVEAWASSNGTSWDLLAGDGIANAKSANNVLTPNTWNHLAYCRSGNNWAVFVNGVRVITVTGVSGTVIARASEVRNIGNLVPYSMTVRGYLSNVRFVIGSTVYDPTLSTITVPTAPLTAIANTQLLTCQSNRLIDTSTNAFAITKNGDTAVKALQPFVIPSNLASYGSGYFDGNGDYLSLTTTAFQHTGDFTYECWVYWNGTVPSDWPMIFDTRPANSSQSTSVCVNIHLSTYRLNFYLDGTNYYWGATALPSNQWVHIALVRNNGVVKIYQNGVVGTDTRANSNTFSGATALRIGASVASIGWWPGYISDFRVTNNAVYTANFTPPTAQLTAITGTILLTAQTNGTSNNNAFRDNSINNFAISRSGNATQGTFSPFGNNWSNYFSGSTNYLRIASAPTALQFGTGDFTIEGWIYSSGSTGTYQHMLTCGTSWSTGSGGVYWYYNSGAPYIGAAWNQITTNPAVKSGTLSPNVWYHFAVVRNGNTLYLYINGVSVSTIDITGITIALTNQNQTNIGGGGFDQDFGGYMSNIRVVKGTAVYTANFTPSTSPLTAIAGTSLLTCQSSRFIDKSTNAFALAMGGAPSIQRFSPFPPGNTYSTSVIGGSAYFDGSGDTVASASTTAFNLGTNPFSIEMWFYWTGGATNGYSGLCGSVTDYKIAMSIWNSKIMYGASSTGSSWNVLGAESSVGSNTIIPNQWNHIVLCRTGTTITAFLNGVRDITVTSSAAIFSRTEGYVVGGWFNTLYYFSGYISNFRFVVGSTPYDATATSITVPTAPLSAISGTQLLHNFTNAGIVDSTMMNDLETVGDAKVSTAQSKFGGSSMYFDGTGDWLVVPASPNTTLGTGDFTIEMWIYSGANGTATRAVGTLDSSWVSGRWVIATGTAGNPNKFVFACNNYANNADMLVSSAAANDSAWHHYAVTRSGNTWRLFVDGVLQQTLTSSVSLDNGTPSRIFIGTESPTNGAWAGYIDDFRITKGLARYTANFTPPTSAFLGQ